jgi:adenylate cyclase class 2
MNLEVEAKFLNVDFDALRTKLTALGATLEQPMRLMRRVIFDLPDPENGGFAFVRVRDEGHQVTLTYKHFHSKGEQAIAGASEVETTVGDFDTTVELLKRLGHEYKSLQEARRETWSMGDAEVVLDEWPWLNPYIEIEGPDEVTVKKIADQLGFAWDDAVFGATPQAYQVQYPEGDATKLIEIPRVAFDVPIPDIISGRKKRK